MYVRKFEEMVGVKDRVGQLRREVRKAHAIRKFFIAPRIKAELETEIENLRELEKSLNRLEMFCLQAENGAIYGERGTTQSP